MGTAAPAFNLQVVGSRTDNAVICTRTSDWVAVVRLENATPTTGRTWTLNAYGNVLPSQLNGGFAIRDETAPAYRLVIDTAGRVGIGRIPTTNRLEVEGTASKTTSGSWLANSDARVKTDIQKIPDGLGVIEKINPVQFRYAAFFRKEHPSVGDYPYYGFIAQEYRKVFPHSVVGGKEDFLYMDSSDMVPYLVKAVQELKSENDALKMESKSLKERIEALEEK